MSCDRQLHATITGRVQGVGFRFFVIRRATQRRLTGWVRNLAGGDVEIVAEGSTDALSELLSDLREGPPAAWVRSVRVDWRLPTGQFSDFHVAPSSYR